ncbi:ribosomal RNA small subunit methyltransferase C [Ruminiclostridium hungatei]|uniref:Ribosomal RNA small subunit methyltransferase C n=2 Tax=Ruminiclostridium hungatei TaxID=48256 RepID=A0A1V4SI17_RUMHU|nr:ribosomal RNA small subunit methyltransferase C [Ruminiclostridium hungatei]
MTENYLFEATIKDITLKFKTSNDVFSPKSIDKGTFAMLSVVDFKETDKVLDLGCGYGVVGILAAKIIGTDNVVMTDKDSIAVDFSQMNAALNNVENIKIIKSDGFKNLDDKDFTLILSNPPYHTDFSVAKEFIEKGFNRLCIGGKMYMVTKRKDWYKNKLTAIFGGVRVWEIDDYFVFMSMKKDSSYANSKKIKK